MYISAPLVCLVPEDAKTKPNQAQALGPQEPELQMVMSYELPCCARNQTLIFHQELSHLSSLAPFKRFIWVLKFCIFVST